MKYQSTLILACLGFCLLVSGCADDNTSDNLTSFDFSEFDAEIEAVLNEAGLDGASVAIVHREEGMIHERAFGTWSVDRQSYIASASKILSAGVLLHLAEEGLLDIDAPISEIIGDWGERDHHDPTLAQILSNSSGMVGLLASPSHPPYLCMISNLTTLGDCGRSIYTSRDERVTIDPDTEYRYGGAAWQLAGAIAEHVSGKTWNTLIDEIYVQPCELGGLTFGNPFTEFTANLFSSRDQAYPPGGLALEPSDNPNIEGGAYTTAGDYGRVLLMHLRGGVAPGGRVLTEASVSRMREDRIASYGGVASIAGFEYGYEGYGLGWWLDRDVPGLACDPGIWGTTPWLDESRGYAGIIMVEGSVDLGVTRLERVLPLAETAVDAAYSD